MKAWKRYLFITLPLSILASIINFYVKDDTTPPPVEEYTLIEFEKDEYQIKDMVTGEVLGYFKLSKEGDELFLLEADGAHCSGTLISSYEKNYKYEDIYEFDVKLEKITCKNLEFYAGKSSGLLWYTIVIMSLDKYDYREFYFSENNRYLFYLIKDGDYNFATKDSAVYDLYVGFNASLENSEGYAAILE